MAKSTIKITGLKELQKKLGKQGQKQVVSEISTTMRNAAESIAFKSRSRVPINNGHLRGSIGVEGKDLLWVIQANMDYATYQEFGSKTMVNIPPEMRDAAVAVNDGKKSYDTFKKAIASWMRNKGIPEEALYPIMAKIMNVGIEPRPFMYPSFQEGTKNLERDINDIIQSYLDK
ncbi:HK97 gp10 family phage protein [Sphingobacterium sp. UT-1RO-CII-1]|uniref:HK97 gp10 family phage protein n=1 Tax=Sphingobacterium sp. UT-1RO-CII-1 TaxID=2995225 RepID=UPI00227BD381|nr:HK97 gp10 family phage protein [Sphingobacterium sp. UT-1RO-CII-1]MCY4781707.1 HK97 gp10 family phage protein [Sphingobacterium sp. UT-1RO-CII-1]